MYVLTIIYLFLSFNCDLSYMYIYVENGVGYIGWWTLKWQHMGKNFKPVHTRPSSHYVLRKLGGCSKNFYNVLPT